MNRRLGTEEAIALLGFLAFGVAFLYPHLPAVQALWPPCLFRELTGYPCGACGFTRAFVRGAHFELPSAFGVSPFGLFVFYLWLLYSLVVFVTWLAPSIRRPKISLSRRICVLAAGLFLVNWIYLGLFRYLTGVLPA